MTTTDSGWLSVRRDDGPTLAVAPDGRERLLDSPAGSELTMLDARWVSEDGRTAVGMGSSTSSPDPAANRPVVVWRC
ncbi:hypothetical protein ACFQ1L_30205 [Phytohabitans flavus]|uniref:hypothetical protein n=1 Tax=Phytohabitans flavus TaxID=1076124 RepID=UPI001565999F|nr:hypothetical protein [Phytohabitans flavus]